MLIGRFLCLFLSSPFLSFPSLLFFSFCSPLSGYFPFLLFSSPLSPRLFLSSLSLFFSSLLLSTFSSPLSSPPFPFFSFILFSPFSALLSSLFLYFPFLLFSPFSSPVISPLSPVPTTSLLLCEFFFFFFFRYLCSISTLLCFISYYRFVIFRGRKVVCKCFRDTAIS